MLGVEFSIMLLLCVGAGGAEKTINSPRKGENSVQTQDIHFSPFFQLKKHPKCNINAWVSVQYPVIRNVFWITFFTANEPHLKKFKLKTIVVVSYFFWWKLKTGPSDLNTIQGLKKWESERLYVKSHNLSCNNQKKPGFKDCKRINLSWKENIVWAAVVPADDSLVESPPPWL